MKKRQSPPMTVAPALTSEAAILRAASLSRDALRRIAAGLRARQLHQSFGYVLVMLDPLVVRKCKPPKKITSKKFKQSVLLSCKIYDSDRISEKKLKEIILAAKSLALESWQKSWEMGRYIEIDTCFDPFGLIAAVIPVYLLPFVGYAIYNGVADEGRALAEIFLSLFRSFYLHDPITRKLQDPTA